MIIILPFIIRALGGRYVSAIAFWPFILVKSKELKYNATLINHEKIHFRQQLELLLIGFYILYIVYYVYYRLKGQNHFNAYMSIPFEREAYEHQEDLNYLKVRRWFAFHLYV